MRIKTIATIFAALATVASAYADTLKGTVVDNNGKPVEYATVVALADSIQKAGTVTDSIGIYQLTLPKGSYTVVFTSVGYDRTEQTAHVAGTTTLNAKMQQSSVMMKELEVKASAIRREPDRFVMMVEDMPSAIGKDGKELLRDAPGVWINDDKITINGQSGAKVYVNDRELKFNDDQLQAFLKSLKAEDVSKIEVIPQAGAEYSAGTSGGVIKITMKKNRADGVMGNVGLSSDMSKFDANLMPSAAVNVKNGKWTFNLNTYWTYYMKQKVNQEENTMYQNGMAYDTHNTIDASDFLYGNVLAGAFYDINDSNTIGLEVNYSNFHNPQKTTTDATFNRLVQAEKLAGRYNAKSQENSVDATFNYVNRLDTLGSTMKFIANYSNTDNSQRTNNTQTTTVAQLSTDSISRSRESSIYRVLNLSYDFDKKFRGEKWSFSAGAKYTLNKMHNDANYEYKKPDWISDTKRNYDERYTENIYAIYAKGSAKFGKFSTLAGLRGEYTDAFSRGGSVSQTYFDLFPYANLTYLIDQMGSNSITLSYSRHISRPSFWSLNPVRHQVSDYFYQTGNPELKPGYQNSISITGVYKYKYSLTAWANVSQNSMYQGTMTDPQKPENVLFTTINGDSQTDFGASLSLPFQIKDWWTLTLNPTYMHKGECLSADAPINYSNMVFLMTSTGFQLPKDFYLDINYYYQGRVKQGNLELAPMHMLGASLKKTFANKRWTASVSADNILSPTMKLKLFSDSYTNINRIEMPISCSVSLTYNFNVGKMFQARQIEKNADESRLQQQSATGK